MECSEVATWLCSKIATSGVPDAAFFHNNLISIVHGDGFYTAPLTNATELSGPILFSSAFTNWPDSSHWQRVSAATQYAESFFSIITKDYLIFMSDGGEYLLVDVDDRMYPVRMGYPKPISYFTSMSNVRALVPIKDDRYAVINETAYATLSDRLTVTRASVPLNGTRFASLFEELSDSFIPAAAVDWDDGRKGLYISRGGGFVLGGMVSDKLEVTCAVSPADCNYCGTQFLEQVDVDGCYRGTPCKNKYADFPACPPATVSPTRPPSVAPTVVAVRSDSTVASTLTAVVSAAASTLTPGLTTLDSMLDPDDAEALSAGAIVAIVLVVVLLLVVVAISLYFFVFKRRFAGEEQLSPRSAGPIGPAIPTSTDSTATVWHEPQHSQRRRHGGVASSASSRGGSRVKRNIVREASVLRPYLIDASEVRKGKKIGEGSFGNVYRGRWNNMTVALKEVKLGDVGAEEAERRRAELIKEALVATRLKQHPNVAAFYGVVDDDLCPLLVWAFFSGGSLDTYLGDESRELPWRLQLRFACDSAAGVAHLHAHGLIHRDLAARNVLLSSDMHAVITDFGMARALSADDEPEHGTDDVTPKVMVTKQTFGPVRWMAPEQIFDKAYSEWSDVYTLANLFYEILTRKEPFHGVALARVAVMICTGKRPDLELVPAHVPDGFLDLMRDCWREDPTERPRSVHVLHRALSFLDADQDATSWDLLVDLSVRSAASSRAAASAAGSTASISAAVSGDIPLVEAQGAYVAVEVITPRLADESAESVASPVLRKQASSRSTAGSRLRRKQYGTMRAKTRSSRARPSRGKSVL